MLPALSSGLPRPVNLRDPMNRGFPLNRRRAGWWLALTPLYGGRQWFDLVGLSPGTLTGGASWTQSKCRPGGGGAVSLVSASSQYVDCGSGPVLLATEVTLAAWVLATSFPNAYNTVASRIILPGGGNNTFAQLFVKSTGKLAMFASTTGDTTVSYDGTGSNTLSAGLWYRLVLTYSVAQSGLKGYVNGALDGSAVGTLSLTTASAPSFTVGRDTNTAGRFWNGLVDDVSVWTRAISAAEVGTDYNLSRQGYPGALNRLSPATVFVSGAPGGNRRRRVLLCAGGG